MSDLLWVAVPGGISGHGAAAEATLRVVIIPRLDGGTLTDNSIDAWPPSELVNATLAVDFASAAGVAVSTVLVNPPHIQPQSDLWGKFFADAQVMPPVAAVGAPAVAVDRTSQKAQNVVATFSTVAATDIPADQTPVQALNATARDQLAARWSGASTPPQPPTRTPPPPFVPPDFHATIALLREHPAVMRALGLLAEIKIQLPAGFAAGVVRVRPQITTVPPAASPWTHCSAQFLPDGSPTGLIRDGMVTLTDAPSAPPPGSTPRWDVVAVDVDHGARRMQAAADAIAAAPAGGADASARFVLPALRSNGLALVRRGRQDDFDRRIEAATAFAGTAIKDVVLTADDLVLGYRIDVRLRGRDWQSLNMRTAHYTVSRNDATLQITAPATEEGHVKAHAAMDDGQPNGTLRTDEVVARWSGWSLAVPRPRFTAPANSPDPVINPAMPYQFRWTHTVPDGTLPPLRFARVYQMRARVADLAGGGLDVADPRADRCFTDLVTYLRYEPLLSPELAMAADAGALAPGEALDRVVIRSDPNPAAAPLVNNLVRVLTPPRSSLTLAEQHGAFNGMSPQQISDLVLHQVTQTPAASPDEVLFRDFALDGVSLFPRPAPGLNLAPTDRAWAEQWPDFKPKQIALAARTDDSPVLEWLPPDQIDDPAIGDKLVVRLAPAEELVLEISATPKSDFLDHFAVNATSLALPQSAVEAVAAGRHPQVSPARALTLTHAVRKPLAAPAGTLTARRDVDQTFATLDPSLPMFGIDTNSTGRLMITATWLDPEAAIPGTVVVPNLAPVASFTIGRGDQVFADDIRHDFADTRHRQVTYLITAVSRFRPFFDAGEPNSGFVHSSTIGPVSVPSSARPPAVAVLSARPAFAWKEMRTDGPPFALTRRRLTGGIRVELDGEWFATGEGELLAVVFAKTPIPAAGMEAFVTRAGADPITIADGTEFGVHPSNLFPSATVAAGDLPAREVMLPEAVEPVVVVPFRPWRADTGWVADLALPGLGDPSANSWPFVELALTRYQPDSVPGCEVSTVVKSEFVQVMPERRLSVTQDGNGLTVFLQCAVSIQFGGGIDNIFTVVLEQLQAPAGTAADAVELAAIAPPSDLPQTPTTDGLPAWVPVDNRVHEGIVGPPQGPTGPQPKVVIEIPAGLAGPLRLRVRESEFGDAAQGVVEQSDELMQRTIYSDIVMLPRAMNVH
jgi:hypothetical protein